MEKDWEFPQHLCLKTIISNLDRNPRKSGSVSFWAYPAMFQQRTERSNLLGARDQLHARRFFCGLVVGRGFTCCLDIAHAWMELCLLSWPGSWQDMDWCRSAAQRPRTQLTGYSSQFAGSLRVLSLDNCSGGATLGMSKLVTEGKDGKQTSCCQWGWLVPWRQFHRGGFMDRTSKARLRIEIRGLDMFRAPMEYP